MDIGAFRLHFRVAAGGSLFSAASDHCPKEDKRSFSCHLSYQVLLFCKTELEDDS